MAALLNNSPPQRNAAGRGRQVFWFRASGERDGGKEKKIMTPSKMCRRVLCFAALIGFATTAFGQGTSTPTRTPTPMISTTPMVSTTPTPMSTTPTRTATAASVTVTPTAGAGAPTSTDQCMNGGWRNFTSPRFKNQGDCVSFVASRGRAGGNPRGSPTPIP
jgi:hypothetical protein